MSSRLHGKVRPRQIFLYQKTDGTSRKILRAFHFLRHTQADYCSWNDGAIRRTIGFFSFYRDSRRRVGSGLPKKGSVRKSSGLWTPSQDKPSGRERLIQVLIYPIFYIAFGLSMPIVTLVVGGRLIWCTFQLARISRYGLAAVAAFAFLLLGGLLFMVEFYWLEYDFAQTPKELWTDLRMDLFTCLPFYGASYALWRFAGLLQSVVKANSVPKKPYFYEPD